MKQFNLRDFLANPERKVVTGEGRAVRIVCTDKKDEEYQIIALVSSDNREITEMYRTDGTARFPSQTLLFEPIKHEGWVNLYKNEYESLYTGARIYATEDKAKANIRLFSNCIATTKIEWEE